MPINPDSRLRKIRKTIHGWKDGDRYFTSLQPREAGAPRNEHASATDALREASRRHLPLTWEDPKAIV